MKRLEIKGQKLWMLTAVEPKHKDKHDRVHWEFLCDCGEVKVSIPSDVRNGRVKSCGCLLKEWAREMGKANKGKIGRQTHGKSKTREYAAWLAMRDRCYNSSLPGYKNHGGRGIKVCDKWNNSFEEFLKDMGEKPSKFHSMDRIDNDGNYEPGNCRWATRITQNRNTRSVVYVEYNGMNKCLSEWCNYFGIHTSSLTQMAKKKGRVGAVEYYFEKYILTQNT